MEAERFQVHIGSKGGSKEVCVRVLIQIRVYCQVRGDLDFDPDLMEACGLPICAGDGAAGDVFIQR